MEKKFLDESTLTYLRNYIDGQDKVIYKTAADLVSSTHLESLTRPATQPDAQVIPSITPENEQQNLTIGDGLEIKDGALTTKKYVEANPTETGTTDLTSLKVNGEVFNIPSGGSGSDVSVFDLAPYLNFETMSIGTEGFNALRNHITNNKCPIIVLNRNDNKGYYTISGCSTEVVLCYYVAPVEGQTLAESLTINSDGSIVITDNENYNVEANPTDTGTEDLTKLKVGKTVYNIPSGSSSGGLTFPTTAPTSQLIPSITTSNTQQNLTVGDGLTIENGVLKATGGGGSGGSSGWVNILELNDTDATAVGNAISKLYKSADDTTEIPLTTPVDFSKTYQYISYIWDGAEVVQTIGRYMNLFGTKLYMSMDKLSYFSTFEADNKSLGLTLAVAEENGVSKGTIYVARTATM